MGERTSAVRVLSNRVVQHYMKIPTVIASTKYRQGNESVNESVSTFIPNYGLVRTAKLEALVCRLPIATDTLLPFATFFHTYVHV